MKSILEKSSSKKAEALMNEEQLEVYNSYSVAKEYMDFVIRRRDSKNIANTLKEVRPMLTISPDSLDSNEYLLCTPVATYDLRLGLKGAKEHSPNDFITKITALSPSDKGMDLWIETLNVIFGNDQELIKYVQLVCGLVVIGKVYVEGLIISYGSGRNGKSTFWNVIARALGTYSGTISAETLTTGCYRNVRPELAEAKGKRLLIAAEMKEGSRLNDSTVKQLCSTDRISAEKKYKAPFSYVPTHTLVLYTNHLPKVSASDDGIWRRLIVLPFNQKIEGSNEIKNFSDYLFYNSGESIVAWLIEAAKLVFDLGYKITEPECVKSAIAKYREQNDWFGHFLREKCDIGEGFKESSSELYKGYRLYCIDSNEYTRSTADFYTMLESAGFIRETENRKRYFVGLRLKPDDGFL